MSASGDDAPVRGLVERIGGPERLRAILRRFYRRAADDLMIGFFFQGHDLEGIAEGQWAFLMWATGARTERPPKMPGEAHEELPPLLGGHLDRRLRLLEEVLVEEGIDPADREAWLRLERSFRGRLQGFHPE